MITVVSEEGQGTLTEATVEGSTVRVPADALTRVFGWDLKPQGICQGDVCIPVQGREGLVADDGIDLAAFADLLGRPFVFDADTSVVHLGDSAQARGAQLASLTAPDFTLPDLHGRRHSLSDYRGLRVLLVAHASW
jgi:hypothetical protein